MRVGPLVGVCALLGLAGCSGGAFRGLDQASSSGGVAGAKLTGVVHGGQQPIAGAQVYLFAAASGASGAGAAAYGGAGIAASASNASVSLLTSGTGRTLDTSGGATNGDYFVTTGSDGSFSITGDYTCTTGQQVYLYALGGNPGSGVNSAAGLMAVLGACPAAGNFAAATPYVVVNEVSTVAAAYAMAGFATDATHVAGSGPAAMNGMQIQFAQVAQAVTLSTGTALATSPTGYQVPQAEINTIANVLASCVNSSGASVVCSTLMANALSGGTTGYRPTDTATAAINIAHNPMTNVGNLYALAQGTPPFAPGLTAQPSDFLLYVLSLGGPAPVMSSYQVYGGVGVPITFDGSGSYDEYGEALTSYRWTFGDGYGATGVSVTHTYSSPACCYVAELSVTDGANFTSTTHTTVVIYGPPTANAGGPYTGSAGTSVTFNGGLSTDPANFITSYNWNFGDGGTATGIAPTHVYATSGSYTATLTVTSNDSLTSKAGVAQVSIAPSGPGINGVVYSGAQPIAGAHVYLLAANTSGYGQPSVSLLNGTLTGLTDSIGAYVVTGVDGRFSWAGEDSCSPGTQVYVYALGGNAGNGTNSASGLLALLGSCPSSGNLDSIPYVWVNEISTVAAAYSVSGFAVDATHVSSSGTALAQVGIANAFANASNLETLSSGIALATTPAGNGTVPQAEINTLANILHGCVISSSACSSLLSTATVDGTPTGVQPTDTASAAINIAHHAGANVASLYALASGSAVYAPVLGVAPNDLTISLIFHVSEGTFAIDEAGNVWVGNGSGVIELSSTGAVLSGSSGYTGGFLAPWSVAIDQSGDAWVANLDWALTELSPSGTLLSGANGYFDGYGGSGNFVAIAIDGLGNAWAGSIQNGSSIVEVSNGGSILSKYGGYLGTGIYEGNCIAIDASEDVWVTGSQAYAIGSGGVTKLSSAGAVLWNATGSAGGLSDPGCIAIDHAGNAWVSSQRGNSLVEFSNSGSILSGANGFTGGSLSTPSGIAIDGEGNVWVVNAHEVSITELSSSGTVLSGTTGYVSGISGGGGNIVIDGSGDLWSSGFQSIVEFVGVAAPVVTPLSVGVKNNMLGTRP